MIFAVVRRRSGAWDFSKAMEEQNGWHDHASYMDRYHSSGAYRLAGPLGDDDQKVLMIVSAESVPAVHHILAADPWTASGLLQTEEVLPWTVRIGEL